MFRNPLAGILILIGGIALMALKCFLLLRAGSRRPHIPEPDEP